MDFLGTFAKLKDALLDGFAGASVPPNGFVPFSAISGMVALNSAARATAAETPPKVPSVRLEERVIDGQKATVMIVKPDHQKLIGEGPYIPDYFARELLVRQPPQPEYKDYARIDERGLFIG